LLHTASSDPLRGTFALVILLPSLLFITRNRWRAHRK
jgi:hypothetical protein